MLEWKNSMDAMFVHSLLPSNYVIYIVRKKSVLTSLEEKWYIDLTLKELSHGSNVILVIGFPLKHILQYYSKYTNTNHQPSELHA